MQKYRVRASIVSGITEETVHEFEPIEVLAESRPQASMAAATQAMDSVHWDERIDPWLRIHETEEIEDETVTMVCAQCDGTGEDRHSGPCPFCLGLGELPGEE